MSNPNPKAPRGARRILAAFVTVVWLGLIAWATLDVADRVASARQASVVSLGDLARTANLLFAAERRAIASELEALRSELRAAQALEHPARLRSLADRDEEETSAEARRLEGLARRALSGSDRLGALDLVVADQEGLWSRGFVRDGQLVRERSATVELQEGVAKALWYSEEVRRAVASAGRSVELGDVSFEGEIARPWLRLAIGLHDAQALVQGALVASADLTRVSGALASIAAAGQRVTLVAPDGRPLDPSIAAGSDAPRWADLTARLLGADAPLEPFEADGQLVLGMPLADPSGQMLDLVLLMEMPAPEVGMAAWLATPWPLALAGLSIASCLAIAALLCGPRPAAAVEAQPASPMRLEEERGARQVESAPVAADDGVALPDGVAPEIFALREWLSDVRGCLEREAATRGLGFALRCERAIPNQALADPAWLGGLLVAMGREALDAAAEDTVSFEVCEEAGDTLRFELDAGGVVLDPSGGMNVAAERLGGRLESGRNGRLALVVPSMLA